MVNICAVAQDKGNSNDFPSGVYKAIVYDNVGYIYVKSDSSFFFLASELTRKKNLQPGELVFSDTITSYGIGRWQLQDSLLILNFTKVRDHSLNKNKMSYVSFSKEPYDSIYLKIHVTTKDKNSPGSFVVGFNSVGKVNLSASNGKISLIIPGNYIDSTIEITKLYYQKQEIKLQRNNNYHSIKISLSREDNFKAANYSLPEKVRVHSRYRVEEGSSYIRRVLKDNIKKFPMRRYQLNKFFELL